MSFYSVSISYNPSMKYVNCSLFTSRFLFSNIYKCCKHLVDIIILFQAVRFLKGIDKRWPEWPGHAGIGLILYAQLMRDFGWEAYK